MQQDQYEEDDLENKGVLSQLWYVLRENWRVVLVVLLVLGGLMDVIVLFVHFNTAPHARSNRLVGLAILFTCILLGIICIFGIVVFVSLFRSSRNQSSPQNTCDVSSDSCDSTYSARRANGCIVEVGIPMFTSCRHPDDHPEKFGNLKSEPKARRGSYLRSRPDNMERKICNSGSEVTESQLQDASGISEHELNRNEQSKFPVNHNGSKMTEYRQRSRLEENEYWSRRSSFRREYLHGNRTGSRLQQYRNDRSSKRRPRTRSETREYKSRTNEMANEGMFLSTRKRKGSRSEKAEYSNREDETEICDLECKNRRKMEQLRKELDAREYLYRDKKLNEREHAILHQSRSSVERKKQISVSRKEVSMHVPKSNKENVNYPFFSTEMIHSLTNDVDNGFSNSHRQPPVFLPSSTERGEYLSQSRRVMDYPSVGNRESVHYASRILEQLLRNTDGQHCFPAPETEVKNQLFSAKERIMYPKCAPKDGKYLPHNRVDMVQNKTVISENVKYLRQFAYHTVQYPPEFDNQTVQHPPEFANHTVQHPPEFANQTVQHHPEFANHTVQHPPEFANHTVQHPPEFANQTVQHPPEFANHTVQYHPEFANHTLQYPPEFANHTVQQPPEFANHTVQHPPEFANHIVQYPPAFANHTVQYPPEFANHTVQHPPVQQESVDYLPRRSNNEIGSYKSNIQLERCSLKNIQHSEDLLPRLSETKEYLPSRSGANQQAGFVNIEKSHPLQNRNANYVFQNAKEYEDYMRYLEQKDKLSRYIHGIEESRLKTSETMALSNPAQCRDSVATVII